MANTLPVDSVARNPRGVIKLNDTPIIGWIDFSVESNNFYSADTFRVTFACNSLPKDRDAAWLSSQLEATIEIFAGFPLDPENYSSSNLESLIYGNVDDVSYDPVNGIISLSGRDLTSKFIDNKTTEKFVNQTSSEIATLLAFRNGLNPVVTQTTAKAGKYYEIDHVNLADQRSEWDLLTYLAHIEGFSIYVRGRDLYFAPKEEAKDVYTVEFSPANDQRGYSTLNAKQISFSRNLVVAKGIVVTIRSWNAKQKAGFTVSYPSKPRTISPGASSPARESQIYSYTIANLSSEAALQRAQKLHEEITQHEMKLEMQLPASTELTFESVINMIGTGTAFDQKYYPDSINRRMDMSSGYTMSVSAKNHSPESEVQL